MGYSKHVAKKKSHSQSEKVKEEQVLNDAGGYVFKVDKWKSLERFLILGNEKGSYYVNEKDMTINNFSIIKELLTINQKKVVDTIVSISDEGRAPKNAPAVFALAVCCVYGNDKTRAYANKSM
jgi:60 kDa SS-A/Ro ribonucleoprotein